MSSLSATYTHAPEAEWTEEGWRKSSLRSELLLVVIASNEFHLASIPSSCSPVLSFYHFPCSSFTLQYGRDGWAAAAQGSRGLVGVIGRAGDRGQTQRRPCHSRNVVQATRFLIACGCCFIRSKFIEGFKGWISQLVVKLSF